MYANSYGKLVGKTNKFIKKRAEKFNEFFASQEKTSPSRFLMDSTVVGESLEGYNLKNDDQPSVVPKNFCWFNILWKHIFINAEIHQKLV